MYLLQESPPAPVVSEVFRRLNRFFASPWDDGLEGPFSAFSSGELMTNVREDEDSFDVEMEVPGVKPEDVEVSLIGTELTVKIRHEESCEEKKKGKEKEKEKGAGRYLRRERRFESMIRTIDLPLEAPPKDVKAELKDGILRIALRKPEPAKVKKIDVAAK